MLLIVSLLLLKLLLSCVDGSVPPQRSATDQQIPRDDFTDRNQDDSDADDDNVENSLAPRGRARYLLCLVA